MAFHMIKAQQLTLNENEELAEKAFEARLPYLLSTFSIVAIVAE